MTRAVVASTIPVSRGSRPGRPIRPDVHARFRAIVAKVDAEVAARPAEAVGVRELLGVTAGDTFGTSGPRQRDECGPSWDDAVRLIER